MQIKKNKCNYDNKLPKKCILKKTNATMTINCQKMHIKKNKCNYDNKLPKKCISKKTNATMTINCQKNA